MLLRRCCTLLCRIQDLQLQPHQMQTFTGPGKQRSWWCSTYQLMGSKCFVRLGTVSSDLAQQDVVSLPQCRVQSSPSVDGSMSCDFMHTLQGQLMLQKILKSAGIID